MNNDFDIWADQVFAKFKKWSDRKYGPNSCKGYYPPFSTESEYTTTVHHYNGFKYLEESTLRHPFGNDHTKGLSKMEILEKLAASVPAQWSANLRCLFSGSIMRYMAEVG